jgi:hypothetical protein
MGTVATSDESWSHRPRAKESVVVLIDLKKKTLRDNEIVVHNIQDLESVLDVWKQTAGGSPEENDCPLEERSRDHRLLP